MRLKPGVDVELVDPENDPRYRTYHEAYHELRGRYGVTPDMAKTALRRSNTLIGAMLVHMGDADALLCGTVGRFDAHLEHVRDVIGLAPGASVDSDMRWVSGNVYDDGHCESPAFITLALGTGTVTAPFHGQLCGAGGKPSTYSITPFREAAMGAAIRLTYTCDDGRTVRKIVVDCPGEITPAEARKLSVALTAAAEAAETA